MKTREELDGDGTLKEIVIEHKVKIDALCERAIGAIYEVANTLGPGFLEKVYRRALMEELRLRDMSTETDVAFPVVYKGKDVGQYFADIVVEDELVIELKCVEQFTREHTAQCLNYLKASGKRLCLLVNFQSSTVEWKRLVLKL